MKPYSEFVKTKKLLFTPVGFNYDGDLNKALFQFQRDIILWALKMGKACLFEDCGLGKGLIFDSEVLTPIGFVKIQHLHTGDYVISSDGNSYPITGVYFRGEQDTYKFYFSDNTSITVDLDHLHICRTFNDRAKNKRWRVLSTSQLLQENIRYGRNGKSKKYDIPIVSPIVFKNECPKILSPYTIGVLIGDGCLSSGYHIDIMNPDSAIIQRVNKELPNGIFFKEKKEKDTYNLVTGRVGNKRHYIRQFLLDIGLLGKLSYQKSIPKQYLMAKNPLDRLALLQGLMDTDGYIGTTSQFSTSSKKLAMDVLFLVRSLGGVPTISSKIPKIREKEYRRHYTITFSLKTFNPFYLSRKAKKWNDNPRDNGRWINAIEYAGKNKTICISVDSPDSTFITDNFIVTHNTLQQLEWARIVSKHNDAPVLLITPLGVAAQTNTIEAPKFGIKTNICNSGAELKHGINITNYEKLHKFENIINDLSGVVLDESGILKSFSGKIRNQIINMFDRTPYRLACSATPAPNDFMELGNHSEFLGIMTYSEMLSMFFINDSGDTGQWRLKKHASELEFWKWLASWAVMLTNPTDIGYKESEDFTLPDLIYHEHKIPAKRVLKGLLAMEASTMQERRQVRKETIEERCKKTAEIINSTNDQWVIWCGLNDEGNLLEKIINDAKQIHGGTDNDTREKLLIGFANGTIKRLVTKASISGYGMNWQHCNKMAFVGLSDSWEQLYQATRRIWRFGQKNKVDAHIIIEEREGAVLKNIKRKDKQARHMAKSMVTHMSDLIKSEIRNVVDKPKTEQSKIKMEIPEWIAMK